ncbi:ataxin-7-like protein 2a isoform X4 [Phyllopteryx taeniolatus]|uniref:ataxin-7-like protein 2a isoform X4 n=1 Tax=Phyllopteryx taeniolatus TaxID=161469 RepID=UPI002AD3D943|nr:ataxin-7-like protein 2a isoform X4 [Phyllopteryx taeniolatus]
MMAVRERAVKVMAALDRRLPSFDDFVGQSWTAWAEWAGVTAPDGPDVDDCSKNGKKAAEAMSLSKEDMSIFGLYPGYDDFYLVVCSHCGQVVKPQAFEKHCERRHGPLSKLYARIRSPAPQPQQRNHHSHSPSQGNNIIPASSWDGRGPGDGSVRPSSQAPSTPPQHRPAKNTKEGVRHSPLEKSSHSSHTDSSVFKQPPPLEPPICSPPTSIRDPPWPHGGTPPGRPSPIDRPHAQRKDSSPASVVPNHRIPRPYNKVASRGFHDVSRPTRPEPRPTTRGASVKSTLSQLERECDLDKHCGVLDPDRKKVCTRLLTCNIHSIHQRRKVQGRTKNFDQLVAELKTKVREKGAQSLEGGSSSGRSPSPEIPRDQDGAPHCRRPLATLPAFSRSTAASESTPENDRQLQNEGNLRAPSPLVHGTISSDESEAEGATDPVEFQSSAAHPKPLAMCSFGGSVLGHGIYTFDRRLHHLRSAFSSMLEQHISVHLWKKIPQATNHQCLTSARIVTSSSPTSITSASSTSSSLHSKIRSAGHLKSSLKTVSSSSSSSRGPGRQSTAILSENSASTGGGVGGSHLLSPGNPVGVHHAGAGRPKNPVGRPSKQMLKLREDAAAAVTVRKRKAPSQEGEHSGPNRNCITLHDRGRPPSIASSPSPSPSSSKAPILSPLPHEKINGMLSLGSKPRPQPSPTESHSTAAKTVWTYRRTHPTLGHSLPPEPSSINNSHCRNTVGDSGLLGQGSGRTFEHQGLIKKCKGGALEEHSPSPYRLPSSSSSSATPASSSPRSNFYPWKDGKSGGLAGGMEKKLGTQKTLPLGGPQSRPQPFSAPWTALSSGCQNCTINCACLYKPQEGASSTQYKTVATGLCMHVRTLYNM